MWLCSNRSSVQQGSVFSFHNGTLTLLRRNKNNTFSNWISLHVSRKRQDIQIKQRQKLYLLNIGDRIKIVTKHKTYEKKMRIVLSNVFKQRTKKGREFSTDMIIEIHLIFPGAFHILIHLILIFEPWWFQDITDWSATKISKFITFANPMISVAWVSACRCVPTVE